MKVAFYLCPRHDPQRFGTILWDDRMTDEWAALHPRECEECGEAMVYSHLAESLPSPA